ncbi:hypothetical protein QCA50_010486 [Cerrena zonata]|uniref:Uncharacterized protein n=1 Tax=Cerrena zonata TaxID=2478898 RepID=A0AAW0G9H0_9APHY
MGFLKRFFSLSSKRSKKSKRHHHEDHDTASHLPVQPEANEDATRLLRSSSAHFSVVKEVDYASLPPIPHPINHIVTPATTPARSASSLQRQGTYTVTVHERTVHSRTEFPNANPPLRHSNEVPPELPHREIAYFDESPTRARFDPKTVPFTPHDQSRVLRLRQDPSVASLLNMFDDKGRINSNAFSNTPRTEAPIEEIGKQQVKRSGSTLRQLLGAPESGNAYDETAMMGDISWAERFLGEHDDDDNDDSASIASSTSLPLETPKDSYPHAHSNPQVIMDTAFSIENSLTEMSVNYPTFSSMEVELSGSTSINVDATCETSAVTEAKLGQIPEFYIAANPETPQRPATEIFGFLTERRKSIRQQKEQQRERELPAVPTPSISDSSSQLKTPMSTSNLFSTPHTNNSSPATTNSDTSSGQIHTATITKLTPVMNPLSRSTDTLNILQSYTPTPGYPKYPLATPSSEHRVRFDDDTTGDRRTLTSQATGSSVPRHHTGSTIRSQPTGSTIQTHTTGSSSSSRPSRIPKGPRPAPIASHETEIAYLGRPTTPSASTSNLDLPSENAQKPSRIPKTSTGVPRSRTPDPFSLPQYSSRQRTTSRGSIAPVIFDDDEDYRTETPVPVRRSASRKPVPVLDKENSPVSSDTPTAQPKTPQSHARHIFDSRHPNLIHGQAPSPASSTELSSFTKDMMTNLRQQKQTAKEARRQQALAFAGFAR